MARSAAGDGGTQQLPETGGIFQYRIKSEMDGHERVVREDQTEHRPYISSPRLSG
jgi:hypothetical protein